MKVVEIEEVNRIMKKLLVSDAFDRFQLVDAKLVTQYSVEFDGTIHPEFYAEEASENKEVFISWKEVRPVFLELVKGRERPLRVKLVFSMKPSNVETFLKQGGFDKEIGRISSLNFTVIYERKEERMFVTTGFARTDFSMDRSVEQYWDDTIETYFRKLVCEE